MAEIFWPDSLPNGLLADGFTKQSQSNVIRTTMNAGAQKARRRYTAITKRYTGKQIFDAAELAVFDQFFHTVLADGVLRFNFEDPITRETAEFRFTAEPTISDVDGLFAVSMQLEKLS